MEDAERYVALIRKNVPVLAPVARWATSEFNERDYASWLDEQFHPLSWKMAVTVDDVASGSLTAEGSLVDGVECSFWLDSSAHGRGLIPASILALEPLLVEVGVTHFEIHAQASNEASRKIAERCGYSETRRYSDRPSRLGVLHVVYAKSVASDLHVTGLQH